MSKILTARMTSKKQLTIPNEVADRLGLRPGDVVSFEIRADGGVTMTPPSFAQRIRPWVGVLRDRGPRPTPEQRARALREMRGSIDE